MSEYTPTTDEVDTGFTTFAWELEKQHPGSYGPDSGFEDYSTVCASFRRWLVALIREAKAEALTEAVAMVSDEEHAFVDKIRGTVVPKLTIIKALRTRAAEYRKAVES